MNNSLIKAASNQHLEFMCMSGSKQGGVGHFIGRDGQDITYKYGDPFYVSIGGTENPGWVQVSSYNTLYAAYQGIYTCRIPDETGNLVDINVGLYCYEFNSELLFYSNDSRASELYSNVSDCMLAKEIYQQPVSPPTGGPREEQEENTI